MLFAGLVSPAYVTVAESVTVGAAAAETLTVRMTLVVAAGSSAVLLVQVTVCPELEHVHPLPAAETNPRPAGNVSTTVIAALVTRVPTLVTLSV